MYILKILTLLASTKEVQIKYLINLGASPSTDELVSEFAYKIFMENLSKKDDFSINPLAKTLSEMRGFFIN